MAGTTGREMFGWAFRRVGSNSWGVPNTVTRGTRFLDDGGLNYAPAFIEDRSLGQSFLGPAEAGDLAPAELTLTGQQRYEDYNYMLRAQAMGSAAVSLSNSATGQTPSFLHILDLAPSIDGIASTFAFDRKLFVEEVTTGKVYGFSETVGEGGVMNESFMVCGVAPTDISSTNFNSTLASATYPSLLGRTLRSQGVFRINAQGGGSLGSSDTITIVGAIEFTFNRPQDKPWVYGSRDITEPADNDFPMPSIRLTFERANTVTVNSFRTALRAGTAYKADITYTGNFINSTDRYSKVWQFPYVELQVHEARAQGAAQVKPSVTFMLKKPASAPTGMSGVTQPFRLRQINANSESGLAT